MKDWKDGQACSDISVASSNEEEGSGHIARGRETSFSRLVHRQKAMRA